MSEIYFLFRVLREEMEHREKLERLQEEQKALLELEREKRMEFEKQQQDKEEQLSGIISLPLTCFVYLLFFIF